MWSLRLGAPFYPVSSYRTRYIKKKAPPEQSTVNSVNITSYDHRNKHGETLKAWNPLFNGFLPWEMKHV